MQTQNRTVTAAQAMRMLQIEPQKKRTGNRKEWGNPEIGANGRPLFSVPEFARFKAHINFKNPKNPHDLKSYSKYYGWDYDNRTGLTNERQALVDILTYIQKDKAGAWNWCTIYMNLTYDLRTAARKFNHTYAHLINGEWIERQGIKFLPVTSHIEGQPNIKVDVEWTVANLDYSGKLRR